MWEWELISFYSIEYISSQMHTQHEVRVGEMQSQHESSIAHNDEIITSLTNEIKALKDRIKALEQDKVSVCLCEFGCRASYQFTTVLSVYQFLCLSIYLNLSMCIYPSVSLHLPLDLLI